MVRVISVHHFVSQNVQTVEQPTASTTAFPNRLLLAIMSNCVEVRDLNNDSDVLFTFPTVDEVIQIVHCLNGDYVATLETKFNRQNKETNFVRVYVNWDSIATLQQSKMTSSGVSLGSSECGMVQPMRARIAGRVTPTTNQSELGSLEMIEIPVKLNPSAIECCQLSGNLLILSKTIINFYAFQVRTHDISKLRFIDFEEMPLMLELPFKPTQIDFCENYVACLNENSAYMFKITKTTLKDAANVPSEDDLNFLLNPNNDPIDYEQLVKNESLKTSSKDQFTINLPSILKENSMIHKNNPFTFCDKDMVAKIFSNNGIESKNSIYTLENLIQLKLIPIMIENAQRQITEEFKCLILKPLYIDENFNKFNVNSNTIVNDGEKFLKSDYRKCLNSVVCMVATQQEGYLFQFNDSEISTNTDNCIALYPFTAPVQKLVMEANFLHALTETGLETYTLRIGHQLCRNFEVVDNINVACPSVNDSICLVGLRPFLGVEQILVTETNLVLLANSDNSPTHSVSSNSSSNISFWTLYNLQLPNPKMIFNDISLVANVHRFTSAQTYCHLLGEAHIILRLVLVLKQWEIMDDDVIKLVKPIKNANTEDVIETYRTSCALLADHYIMCTVEEDYKLALPYYKMARVTAMEVLNRVRKIQEQSNNQNTIGLVNYLKSTLMEIKAGPEADRFFGSKQNFSETILQLLEVHGYDDLPNLILKSKILREYSTDKLISILNENMSNNCKQLAEKYLALSILYIQKCNSKQAENSLNCIDKDNLRNLLLENWELLFETSNLISAQNNRSKSVTTFSELATLLIGYQTDLMADIFVKLMVDLKVVNLSKMIKVFLEYLPSSIGSDNNGGSCVLQKTLEQYFEEYFARTENKDLSSITYEKGASEAMKLLVRSYLSQLQIFQLKDEAKYKNLNIDANKCESTARTTKKEVEILGYNQINRSHLIDKIVGNETGYLFANLRHSYLNEMPPFKSDVTAKLYVDNNQSKYNYYPNEEADLILKKLQALLCSQVLPKPIICEVNTFLTVNDNLRGKFALQTITMTTNDAILLLMDVCPQALLQFGKDRFNKVDEWKYLIANVQKKILKLSQNRNLEKICAYYKQILDEILTHVAKSVNLDELLEILPQRFSTADNGPDTNDVEINGIDSGQDILKEIQNYDPYFQICKQNMRAALIHKSIEFTGHQLLCNIPL